MTQRIDTDTEERMPTGYKVTSKDSAKETGKNKNEYRRKIHGFIQTYGPHTCDEIEVRLGLRHQTASCIITFLAKDGFLVDSGERRLTRSNRKATVWKASVPNQPNAVQITLIPAPARLV